MNDIEATTTDRQSKYGHPIEHFGRTAGMLTAIGVRIWDDVLDDYRHLSPEDWGLFMILDKVARERGPNPVRDNVHDIQGYARCIEMIRDL